ncbi:PQQ-dependent sugar dehydrogenase [Steroidobacter sp.]|uniref:PQQ-dependent sugar dehydrogenase n=1 Tax=Steroidobacter sp. TaxID=1978227 RepID=UPI0025FAF4C7|nr:PQQ-dependent sugar dehydrogenase [Steroidobacter sp.]
MRIRSTPGARSIAWLLALVVVAAGHANVSHAKADEVSEHVAASTYIELCSSCHGRQLEGGQGPSLIDDRWLHGGDDDSIANSIAAGVPAKGMPGWSSVLSPQQIRDLVVFIEQKRLAAASGSRGIHDRDGQVPALPREVQHSRLHDFRVEPFVDGLAEMPYGFAFLSPTRLLVTERRQALLRVVDNGRLLPDPVQGTPATHRHPSGAGALLDVAVHPQYRRNGWIYLSFADDPSTAVDSGRPEATMRSLVAVVRGRIVGNRWVDQQTLWQAPDDVRRVTADNEFFFGGRMAFDRRGHLYFSIGVPDADRDEAQDLALPRGKIFRLLDDGGIPRDNPFAARSGALPGIFSLGHRNPQGLAFDSNSAILWSTEHGPRGGDELNRIMPGRNYGWPRFTYGTDYDGTAIARQSTGEGFESPLQQWTPSIAISALAVYDGRAFPRWQGSMFIGSLKAEQLLRVRVEAGKVVEVERILSDLGRIRDIQVGLDGCIYLLVEALGSKDRSRIIRLVPSGG